MAESTCPKCGASLGDSEGTDEELEIRWDGYISGRSGLAMDRCPYKGDEVPRWNWEKRGWWKMQQWRAGWRIGVRAAKQIQEPSHAPN